MKLKLLVIFASALLFAGCGSIPKQFNAPAEPMILVMTVNQSGWYRCVVMKGPEGATLDWVLSPVGAMSAKDDIQVRRQLSRNEFDALFGILESDRRLAPWKKADQGNVTLDHGLLITLKPEGAFSEKGTLFDIDPTPAAAAVINEIKERLRYREIEKLGRNEN
jgi:hypothetical protein